MFAVTNHLSVLWRFPDESWKEMAQFEALFGHMIYCLSLFIFLWLVLWSCIADRCCALVCKIRPSLSLEV